MDFTECYQDTCSTVALAARIGNTRQVRQLIQKGYSVDVKDNRGWNALHEAAASGSVECVRVLLVTAGCDYVNSLTHHSETPLYLAVKNGHLRVVKRLMKAQADINLLTNDLSCPLYAAVDAGHREIVELLVNKGAELNRTHTASSWTCLHQAVYRGRCEIVRFLSGVCHPEARDDHGITPLFVSAQYGQDQCLQILADAGANVNSQADDLATPLLIASQEGHLTCVEVLLAHGADPNLYCSEDQRQLPIHAAAEFGRISVLRRLIPLTDRVCDRGKKKLSPVYMAVLGNQAESLELLLREGFSPDAQEQNESFGYTFPLSLAVEDSLYRSQPWPQPFRLPDTVRVLLIAGARVSVDVWSHALDSDNTDLLEHILQHRPLSGPTKLSESISRRDESTRRFFLLDELEDLAVAAINSVDFAPYWLPVLFKAGLDPYLLTLNDILKEVESEVLNYFLEFVNWKTLPSEQLNILSQRHATSTWHPRLHLESLPPLSHLCRLAVRGLVGSVPLMQPAIVERLPVPLLIQQYLQFSGVHAAYRLTP